MSDQAEITRVLKTMTERGGEGVDRLLPLVYDELRQLAQAHLRHERPDHTLQATALAHEAYLRLVDQEAVEWRNRAHFFAVAAQAIRRILVDHARGRLRKKRGGHRKKLSLDEALVITEDQSNTDLLSLDAALTKLADAWPKHARVIEMRFFGGLTLEDTAEVLGVTTRTIERYWQFARAWLYREIAGAESSMTDDG